MAAEVKKKDPNAVKRYFVDWRKYMTDIGETLTGSTWVVPVGITKVSDSYATSGLVQIVLSGGTLGTQYTLVNRVTTATQTLDQTLIIDCVEE